MKEEVKAECEKAEYAKAEYEKDHCKLFNVGRMAAEVYPAEAWEGKQKTLRSVGRDYKAAGLGNYPLNIPIQMVAATDRDGKVTPMWFRYETREHEVETVKILQTEYKNETCYMGIREKRYVCTVSLEEIMHRLDIRYHTEKQTWRIFRFLS